MKKKKSKLGVNFTASGVSNNYGSFGGGSLKFDKPISKKSNVSVTQGYKYRKPKDKGFSIAAGNTTVNFEKKLNNNKRITGSLSGNIKDKNLDNIGIKFEKRFDSGITGSLSGNIKDRKLDNIGIKFEKNF